MLPGLLLPEGSHIQYSMGLISELKFFPLTANPIPHFTTNEMKIFDQKIKLRLFPALERLLHKPTPYFKIFGHLLGTILVPKKPILRGVLGVVLCLVNSRGSSSISAQIAPKA